MWIRDFIMAAVNYMEIVFSLILEEITAKIEMVG
jgi:hypothetical protein